MYSPYSNSSQRNKSRLYIFVFLAFVAIIIYWRYSSSSNQKLSKKGAFQSAGEHADSLIGHAKHKVRHAVDNVKDKVDDVVDGAKEKAKKVADTVEQAAADTKKKL